MLNECRCSWSASVLRETVSSERQGPLERKLCSADALQCRLADRTRPGDIGAEQDFLSPEKAFHWDIYFLHAQDIQEVQSTSFQVI